MTGRSVIAELPGALESRGEIRAGLAGREPVVFLDYDGTLTPIVEDPAAATLDDSMREVIARLADACPTAVVSGRDLDDVRAMVDLDGIHYAGSHGFDILTEDGERVQRAQDHLPALDAAEDTLRERLDGLAGVEVERKRFAIAVHHRRAEQGAADDVAEAVEDVIGDGLRKSGGKEIVEVRPDVDWDKGKALLWLLTTLDLDRPDVVPFYVGDDVTDEDAFRAIADDGLGLVVRGEDDQRPTAADYAFADTDEARTFLEGLAQMLRERR